MASEKADVPPTVPTCPPLHDPPPQYTPAVPQQPSTDFNKEPSGEIPTQSVNYVPQQGVNPTPGQGFNPVPQQGVAFAPQGVTYVPQGVTYVPQAGPYTAMEGAYAPQGGVYPYGGPQVVTPATQMMPRTDGAPPPDNMVFAIIVAAFCCFILGILAIVKSMDSRKLWQLGDAAGARRAADQSRRLSIIGLVVGLILEVTLVVLIIILVVVGI